MSTSDLQRWLIVTLLGGILIALVVIGLRLTEANTYHRHAWLKTAPDSALTESEKEKRLTDEVQRLARELSR